MDYSPKLQRQRSPSCMALDIGQWCCSRQRTTEFGQRFSEDDDFDYPSNRSSSSSSSLGTRWRGLCRRIAKEKRRILKNSADPHEPYDPYTYAQNFDEGSAWLEPENLSRSFSARFAVPSTMLLQRVS